MKRITLFALACIIGASLTGCIRTATDRAQADRKYSDNPATIVCHDYSGIIFSGRSVGKPQRSDTGEGMWEFVDSTNGKFTQVEGNCVVAYD